MIFKFLHSAVLSKTLIILVFFLACHISGFARISADTLTASDAAKVLKQANKYFSGGDYNAALLEYQLIEKFYKNDPDYNYNFGTCLLHESFDRKKGIGHLFISANSGNVDAYRMIAWGCHLMYDFKEALKFYHIYQVKADTNSARYKKSGAKKMIEETHNAIELTKNPVNVEINNVGKLVNSEYPDYVPVITADDQEMYFTSRRETSTGGKKDFNKQFFEDIFHTVRDSVTQEWTKAKHLHDILNSHGHDAIAGLSADGHTLLIYRNDVETGLGDIYVSYLRGNDWTEPKMVGGDISRKESWEPSASLTANEDALYFSSNRVGGYGGTDLYIAKRMPNGEWGNPVNLGPMINTAYDDDAPYIHPDGKTLYFSSKGHKNIGGFDIYKSVKDDSGRFQQAETMGYPINTTDDDIYFVITADGEHGYYASLGADSYGEKDIYMITFKIEDKALVVLKGKVVDDATDKPLSSMIFVSKVGNKKLNGYYNSNALTGKYLVVMQPGIAYKVAFTLEGYYPDTLLVNTEQINSFNSIEKNIRLRKKAPQNDTTATASIKKEPETIVVPKKQEPKPEHIAKDDRKTMLIDTMGMVKMIAKAEEPVEKKKEPKADTKPVEKNKNEVVATLKTNKEKETKTKPKVQSQPMSLETVSGKAAPTTSTMVRDCNLDLSDSSNTISLNFGYNMNTLKPEQFSTLEEFFKPFKSKVVGIRINAHTDNKGSQKYNQALSERRASSVADFLKRKGFASKKLFACYYGETKPLVPNENPDGSDNENNRYLNRRSEIEFVVTE